MSFVSVSVDETGVIFGVNAFILSVDALFVDDTVDARCVVGSRVFGAVFFTSFGFALCMCAVFGWFTSCDVGNPLVVRVWVDGRFSRRVSAVVCSEIVDGSAFGSGLVTVNRYIIY